MKRALLAMLLLSGCVMQGMDEGEETGIGDGITVTAPPSFAQIQLGGRYWTRNGSGLDELHFYTGIKPGQPLLGSFVKKKDAPFFTVRMTPNDIEDLTAASLEKAGAQNVRATGLRPCPFGSQQGFCFDLALANEEGLEMKGKALAAVRGGLLDMLLFTAPAEYYFGETTPAVDRVFASVTTRP